MTSVSRSNRASREQASPRCGALHGYADDAPHMDVNMDMDMDMSMPMPMPGPMGHHMKMHGMEMPM